MIGGAITVETVYSWPGLGYLTFTALQIPDLPLLEGTFIVFSATVIVFNLLADILLPLPRSASAPAMTVDRVEAPARRGTPSRLRAAAPVRPRLLPPAHAGSPDWSSWWRSPGLRCTAPLFIHAERPERHQCDRAAARVRRRARYPLGTDQPGRSVLLLVIWGARPSLAIGVIATVLTMVARQRDRPDRRPLRGFRRPGADARHRLVHRDPEPAAGHLAGRGARPGRGVDHHRHRRHLVDRAPRG